MAAKKVVVVGSGVFGLSSALSLARRGHEVTVFEKGTIADPLAASTDISKVVRIEYGQDDTYMSLGEKARAGWQAWNKQWEEAGLCPLYHETGALMCSRSLMSQGQFEYDSFHLLTERGHKPVRLTGVDVARRFPAWNPEYFGDGFYNPLGGFVESGKVMYRLAEMAADLGVRIVENARVEDIQRGSSHVSGVTVNGENVNTGCVVLAAGAWSAQLWPRIDGCIRPTGHPVFHFVPEDPTIFRSDVFPTFLADVSRTGYYGFPLSDDGVVKIGKHGIGVETNPDGRREIAEEQFTNVRDFLASALPPLATAELVYSRLCLYADSEDSDFWVCEDPDYNGLFITGGGSGHGYKFAPVIGDIVADAIDNIPNEYLHRFRWRPEVRQEKGNEASRCHDVI